MTDVIVPQPDDPVELRKQTYLAWLKMSASVLGARELKAAARKALAELELQAHRVSHPDP